MSLCDKDGFVPSKQGSLDNLCGVYCLVNALAYLYAGQFKQRYRLKFHLLEVFQEQWKLSDLVCDGTTDEQLEYMLQKGLMTGVYAQRYPVKFDQPFVNKSVRSVNTILKAIRQFLSRKSRRRVVIVATPYHWTLIKKVDDQRVYFIDSSTLNTAFLTSFKFDEHARLELLKDSIYFLERGFS